MRYFFDFEFNENVDPVQIISLGIVAEDGREWYGIDKTYRDEWVEFGKANTSEVIGFPAIASCNEWVRKNVLPILWQPPGSEPKPFVGNPLEMRAAVVDFCTDDKPEFWAYFGDYDWYLLTRMFRSFDKMPSKWPQICYDLHQYARHLGLHRELPPKFVPTHNALIDARWTKAAFEKIYAMREKGLMWP